MLFHCPHSLNTSSFWKIARLGRKYINSAACKLSSVRFIRRESTGLWKNENSEAESFWVTMILWKFLICNEQEKKCNLSNKYRIHLNLVSITSFLMWLIYCKCCHGCEKDHQVINPFMMSDRHNEPNLPRPKPGQPGCRRGPVSRAVSASMGDALNKHQTTTTLIQCLTL